MDRQPPRATSDEIDLYIRTYYSLLRSSGDVRVRAFEEAHLFSRSSLHLGAEDPSPDLAAFAYSAARAHDLPGLDRKARGMELPHALPEHDAPDARHAVRESRGAVRERGEVGARILGAEVQARAREQVRLFERAHANVAARPQQRVVGPDIEIDLVAGRARGLAGHGILRVDTG